MNDPILKKGRATDTRQAVDSTWLRELLRRARHDPRYRDFNVKGPSFASQVAGQLRDALRDVPGMNVDGGSTRPELEVEPSFLYGRKYTSRPDASVAPVDSTIADHAFRAQRMEMRGGDELSPEDEAWASQMAQGAMASMRRPWTPPGVRPDQTATAAPRRMLDTLLRGPQR